MYNIKFKYMDAPASDNFEENKQHMADTLNSVLSLFIFFPLSILRFFSVSRMLYLRILYFLVIILVLIIIVVFFIYIFNLICLYGAHGFGIFQHFLSTATNQRTDEYGGSLENRARFVKEVVEEVRNEVGDTMGITLRLSLDEMIGDLGFAN